MSAVSSNVNAENNSVAHNQEAHHDMSSNTVLGFWIYILTDCIIFAAFFATYAVLFMNTAGGVSGKDIFDINYVAIETFAIMSSSLTFGLAMVNAHRQNKGATILWLFITFVLGMVFVGMASDEFYEFIQAGNGPGRSAFLTAFFSLVGLHLLHVIVGGVWIITMIIEVSRSGLENTTLTSLKCLNIFWNFLDIVWVCVFTFVYLMGVM